MADRRPPNALARRSAGPGIRAEGGRNVNFHAQAPLHGGSRQGPVRQLISEMLHTPSELVVVAGTWLIVAPLVLDHDAANIAFLGWNDVIVGLLLVGLAALRVVMPDGTAPLSLITMALGVWLVFAPFVRGYHVAPLATLNDILIGATVAALAWTSWRKSVEG
jgi:hypothetical protein